VTIRDGLRNPIRAHPNVPIAIQVANHLRGRLRREFANGGRLPGELVIAADLGVSRGTVRQALAILQHEGLISRRQGLGTFANPNVSGIPARIDFAYEFTELITAAGYVAEVKTLENCLAPATAEAAQRLEIEPGEPMRHVRKLFLASGRPAIYEDEVLPTRLIRDEYDPAELQQPIWSFIAQHCRRHVKYVLSELQAIVAGEDLARLLGVAPASPMLEFVEVFYDSKNEPLALTHIFFQHDMIRFRALRKVSPVI